MFILRPIINYTSQTDLYTKENQIWGNITDRVSLKKKSRSYYENHTKEFSTL